MTPSSWLALAGIVLLIAWLAYVEHQEQRSQRVTPPDALVGKASWYGEAHRGLRMANGQAFDPDRATCATWHWPIDTILVVKHGTRSVQVRVTDRGPNRRFPDRIVDLSRSAFAQLADPDVGLIDVTVTPLP